MAEWQPIETMLKQRGRVVLLHLSGNGYHGPRQSNIVTGMWTDSGWYYVADGGAGRVSGEPTHWMPLPDPPERS